MKPKTILIGLLIMVALLIVAGIGGYLVGQKKEGQASKKAQEAAKAQAATELKTAVEKAKAQALSKAVTDATCNADELSVAINLTSAATASTLTYDLAFTNIGKRACVLAGYPGVWLVNDNGNQIGTTAEHDPQFLGDFLNLAPGTKGKSTLSIANKTSVSEGECKSGATKLRVFPPTDTGYISLASPVDSWCPGFKVTPIVALK